MILPMSAGGKCFKHQDLTAREQGRDDLEGGILGGGADQDERAPFDMGKKIVLLRFIEVMDLVDEQHRRFAQTLELFGVLNDFF